MPRERDPILRAMKQVDTLFERRQPSERRAFIHWIRIVLDDLERQLDRSKKNLPAPSEATAHPIQ